MNLSIGMAVYDDLRGLKWTIQCLRDYPLPSGTELVVVNNNPDSQLGQEIRNWIVNWVRPHTQLAYIDYGEIKGTAPAKNKVFDIATGDIVCCIDAHVRIQVGGIESLLSYFASNPDTPNLVQGPLVYDDLKKIDTHFADGWRGGMWGMLAEDVRGHGSEPFEIPAQGMGLFACRKSAWLGFNPAFREFGGEEWYIHEKFRQAGAKCICIPQLLWWHDFTKGHGVAYPASGKAKIRNYIIGLTELGLPLDRARRHFVEGLNEDGSAWDQKGTLAKPQIRAEEWDALTANPSPAVPPKSISAPTPTVIYKKPHPAASKVKVGDELHELLSSIGITEKAGCNCKAKQSMMNQMTLEGCKKSRHQLAGMLRDEAEQRSYGDKIKAAAKSVTSGLLAKIGIGDPYLGLIDEAIRRAEEKEMAA